MDVEAITRVLEDAVAHARQVRCGGPATYIPELARAPVDHLGVAAQLLDGACVAAGDDPALTFTLQSSAKLVILLGLLEERGFDEVFRYVGSEPSGASFASVARLEEHGPLPSNPFVNAGAIALCGQLDGNLEDRIGWIEGWAAKLYGRRLSVSSRVLASERRTGDRNRALAYLLRTNGVFARDVDDVLEVYFTLCSLEATVSDAAQLPAVLANGGVTPAGERVIREDVAACAVSLMATSGMYDESGAYLRGTGLPAKSGVSGIIVAVAPGRAGIAAYSPGINAKGGSTRGHVMLREISRALRWHFAMRRH